MNGAPEETDDRRDLKLSAIRSMTSASTVLKLNRCGMSKFDVACSRPGGGIRTLLDAVNVCDWPLSVPWSRCSSSESAVPGEAPVQGQDQRVVAGIDAGRDLRHPAEVRVRTRV